MQLRHAVTSDDDMPRALAASTGRGFFAFGALGSTTRSAGCVGGGDFMLDAADGAHLAIFLNGAGAGHKFAAGEVFFAELIDDRQGKHHASGWTTDILQVVCDLYIVFRDREHGDAQHRLPLLVGVFP